MTDVESVEAYAVADLSELHEPLVDAFHDRFGDQLAGRLLDIGCGAADMAIRFARRHPALTVVGIDGSGPMLTLAAERVRAAGLDRRITLEQRCVPDDALERGAFEAVIANSVLHHVDEPVALWRGMARAVRPGAPLMVMDLHRRATRAEAERLVAALAADARPVLQRDFLNSLCAAYTRAEIEDQVAAARLPGITVERLGRCHVIAWGRAPGRLAGEGA